jgi:hypothetical protein
MRRRPARFTDGRSGARRRGRWHTSPRGTSAPPARRSPGHTCPGRRAAQCAWRCSASPPHWFQSGLVNSIHAPAYPGRPSTRYRSTSGALATRSPSRSSSPRPTHALTRRSALVGVRPRAGPRAASVSCPAATRVKSPSSTASMSVAASRYARAMRCSLTVSTLGSATLIPSVKLLAARRARPVR